MGGAAAEMSDDFDGLMDSLYLGDAASVAAKKWMAKPSFGNVVVYGDYDVDGIASTVLGMEIFRAKASGVRYYIPKRDTQGYGLHASALEQIAKSGCNTLVVVDCGSNDAKLLRAMEARGIDVFVFDHHSVNVPDVPEQVVNPFRSGDKTALKLCATAVLWCWAWKENIAPRQRLKYALDLAALATLADCMSLHPLNKLIVRRGIELMRSDARRGLAILLERLGLPKQTLSEEQLSMSVIPCLNAPGRVYYADAAVGALLGMGDVPSFVDKLLRANVYRKTISDRIIQSFSEDCEQKAPCSKGVSDPKDAPFDAHSPDELVIFDKRWPVGVLSGVASRICGRLRTPIALAAMSGDKIRGTLRVPEGANAVGILSEIQDVLYAWGGHRYAAGFSVLSERWPEVQERLKELLSKVTVEEEQVKAIAAPPCDITLDEWKAVVERLGPFGNDNPRPFFYVPKGEDDQVVKFGRDGQHCAVIIGGAESGIRLLAFGSASELDDISWVKGWVYHPRVDFWQGRERVQFLLDYVGV
ncbi:MAG: DHH family phosphoesterase [Synergistaceae bacterium]|nr:DHH family phosphoesterase [Synergistaceae bacterium]